VLTAITTPEFLWILIGVVLVVLAIMALISPQIDKAYIERQARLDDVNAVLQENLAGVRVVKAFVREDYEVERFTDRADAMRKPAFAAAFRVAALTPILNTITLGASALVVWLGGRQIIEGTGLSLGEIVTFNQYLNLVIVPLALLAVVTPAILRGDTSARRVYEVYDDEPALEDDPEAAPLDRAAVGGRVVFDDVTFAFRRPDGEFDPPVLENIDLVIEPGERVGVLGATGSGKSALVNLVPRFYDTTGGSVTIDGVDVREFRKEDLRQVVGVALQEALLFQGTVRDNLKFGNPDVDDDVMFSAARAADAYGFVTNLPEEWEAPVARRGYNFSGGQRQRMSIGRALTTLPRILILDDSTSATDVATEGRIQDAIPEFTDGITTIYVAQRISAVIDLDKIVILDNGRIDAIGTHLELLESNHLYQEIYESQLGGGVSTGPEEVGR
jgi:ATP-binding cassette subfamily B protein